MENLAQELLPDPPGNRGLVVLEVGWDRFQNQFEDIIWHVMNVLAADKIQTQISNAVPLPGDSN